jgi:hypothetical protein
VKPVRRNRRSKKYFAEMFGLKSSSAKPPKIRPVFKLATLEGLASDNPALGGLVGVLVDLATVPKGFYTYSCGNPRCKRVFVVTPSHLPQFCRGCGSEFDWSPPPPPTRTANICLKCKIEYYEKDKFCERCGGGLTKAQLPLT